MLRKYFATRYLSIDGREYNAGDIVFFEHDLDGLVLAGEDEKEKVKAIFLPESKFLGLPAPFVSVVITFHNQLRFVKDCLNGFLGQTISRPYEILVIVDKSEEGEADFIRKNFPKVRVIETGFGNACEARNIGIEMARGELITFFDGDDFPYCNYLKALSDELIFSRADFAYARFDHEDFPDSKGRLPRCNCFEWGGGWEKYSPITNTPVLLWRKDCPAWPEDLPICQDMGFCLKMSKKNLQGVHCREKLFFYRKNSQSVWNNYGVAEKKKKSLEVLQKKYGLETKQADLTFISLISRDEVLEEYFAQIPLLGMPKKKHWLVLIDTNDEALILKVKKLAMKRASGFLSVRFFVSGEKNLADSKDFDARGLRIARWIKVIVNQCAEKMGGTPFLFMVEDDTRAPRNAFKTLMATMQTNERIAYVSGVECGRGFTRHTGVCNLIKDEQGEVVGRDIPKMQNSGIVPIGGGGFYCWIGRVNLLKKFIDRREFRSVDGKMLGVDVLMVNDLRTDGLDCFCDFSVQCDHYNGKIKKWLPASDGKGYDIRYFQEGGAWKMALTNKL